jgi:hypothetical protein
LVRQTAAHPHHRPRLPAVRPQAGRKRNGIERETSAARRAPARVAGFLTGIARSFRDMQADPVEQLPEVAKLAGSFRAYRSDFNVSSATQRSPDAS